MAGRALSQIERLAQLAEADPDRAAVVSVSPDGAEVALSGRVFFDRVRLAAARFKRDGVNARSLVIVALPNGLDHVVACHGAWWLGACVMPLSPRLPAWEFSQVIGAAGESGRELVVIGELPPGTESLDVLSLTRPSAVLPDTATLDVPPIVTPDPGVAIPSGGSTGRSKVIVDSRPMVAVPDEESATSRLLGHAPHHRVLVIGPLYHTGPFGSMRRALFDGGLVVIMEQFDAGLALELIERHAINRLFSVPAQLQRMARDETVTQRDLSSIETLYHSGAVCPPWLKRFWIDRLGAERVVEGYGSTEAIGALGIRGDEWLQHPGSVGRPQVSDVKILDEEGGDVPAGEVGEVFMRWRADDEAPTNEATTIEGSKYLYWGSPAATHDEEGYVSVGDLGRFDVDGYVYIVDRRVDMIVSGGANIYPAEIEAVLSGHDEVADVAVVGVPDERWGRRVHAIVETASDRGDLADDLDRWTRTRLGPTKVPKSYEFVRSLPRNEAGKLRRKDLTAEREHDGEWAERISRPARSADRVTP